MRKQEGSNSKPMHEAPSVQRLNEFEEYSEQGDIQQVLVTEENIDELYASVNRLREFVAGLAIEIVSTFPLCVEEYCEKLTYYRVESKEEVLQMAQSRVNKMIRNRKVKRNWNAEDIRLLVWLVSKRIQLNQLSHFSEMQQIDWEFISNLISGSSWQRCKFRWLSLKKVKLVTHKWSKTQSKLLSEKIAEAATINWRFISEKLYEDNPAKNKVFRTAKQCREHWNCFLNPNIQKGPWSLQEDQKLLEYVLQLEGSKKWSEISKFMEGRTENALKNRFTLLVNRQRKISGNLTEKRIVKLCLNRLMIEQGRSRMQVNSPIQPAEPQRPTGRRNETGEIRIPIIPTRIQSNSYNMDLGLNYDSLYSMGSNVDRLMSTSSLPTNAFYFCFFNAGQIM